MLPVARTRDEAHLYMDLHPCDACGTAEVTWDSGLTHEDGVPARRYAGRCRGCGADREFVFAVPDRPELPGAQDVVFFGAEPSQLLDAGEWLLVSDLCAQAGSVPPEDQRERAEARESMAVAAAAVAEVLKFLPPGGDEVPDSAFWSARGRTVRDQEPGRFRRRRLDIVADTYRDALDRM
ncbi:MAG TPA: hypothetical protein VJT31_29560 [Rugosimonospora sp.]|nr:hypothetical protein [Rugosimonospora sp.]